MKDKPGDANKKNMSLNLIITPATQNTWLVRFLNQKAYFLITI